LTDLQSESLRQSENIVLSHVQARIQVPYDRLKTYIIDLVNLGLIEDATSMKITKKGKAYLKEYSKILNFMRDLGLTYQ
ncbi:MAG: winged helix-turn-helix domain-containing protein, partial [Candidatus Bathyarchaeota archaeon]